MITLTEKDIELIEHAGFRKSVKLSSGSYYVKGSKNATILKNELIGSKLAQVFHLNCPKYHFLEINGYYYILSEDLNQDGIFKSIDELNIAKNDCSISQVWESIEAKYQLTEKILFDLVKIYIFDSLFLNHDRDPMNYGLLFQLDGTKEVVILDQESILEPLLTLKLYYETSFLDADIEAFLMKANSEFIQLFLHYYHLITPEYLENLFHEVEIENHIILEDKARYLQIYQMNYQKIDRILKSCEVKKLN